MHAADKKRLSFVSEDSLSAFKRLIERSGWTVHKIRQSDFALLIKFKFLIIKMFSCAGGGNADHWDDRNAGGLRCSDFLWNLMIYRCSGTTLQV